METSETALEEFHNLILRFFKLYNLVLHLKNLLKVLYKIKKIENNSRDCQKKQF
jgi:hypothetical protein